jgi:malic enzyme
VLEWIDELAPIVYTPTIGEVCKRFGSYFQRARGMYLSSTDKGAIKYPRSWHVEIRAVIFVSFVVAVDTAVSPPPSFRSDGVDGVQLAA